MSISIIRATKEIIETKINDRKIEKEKLFLVFLILLVLSSKLISVSSRFISLLLDSTISSFSTLILFLEITFLFFSKNHFLLQNPH